MIRALAPGSSRGLTCLLLAALGLGLPGLARGQGGPPQGKSTDAKAAVKPDAAKAAKPDAARPGPAGESAEDEAKVERYVDPNAKATLEIFKPQNYVGAPIRQTGPGNALVRVQNMASKVENEDAGLVKNYIEFFAAELTKRDNINALINPPANMAPNAPQSRGLERAVDALTRPIIDARANNNTAFLASYTRALFESSLPKLMDNNFLTRLDAMIVLGMAGGTTNAALDFYAGQLKAADQVVWVKMWAAKGYTNAAQSGRNNIDAARAQQGADALVTFLNSNPQMAYFAQCRALEALGSIRVATVNRPELKLDVASVVAGYLVNLEARIETRAWAAWALGMMRVAPQVTPYNYSLAGYEVGEVAADLGTKIVAEYDQHAESFDRDKDRATTLAAHLMFQLIPAVAGEEAISDSGLLRATHPDAGAAKPFLAKLDERIKALGREAYELSRAGGVAQKGKRDDVAAKVADLKALLDQNKPKDRRLVPGGPLFAVGGPNAR